MTARPDGSVKVSARGRDYTLFVGMSVLADLQSKHGQDVFERLEPPEGASPTWMPDLAIVTDLFMGALERHHPDDVDRWVVDDIIAENDGALLTLMRASFPDPVDEPGKPTGPKAAA